MGLNCRFGMIACAAVISAAVFAGKVQAADPVEAALNAELRELLDSHSFTGRAEQSLESRLGRKVDGKLAELGRSLFFDKILGLRGDNSCAGCHAPQFGFADSQSIAIGVMSNDIVGPNRTGPRNQRRSPMLLNTAFYPALMWNTRFSSLSGDPFDNSQGFSFPMPEGLTQFPANDPAFKHLLTAQANLPPTELVEMTGFAGTAGSPTLDPIFYQFDDGIGHPVPEPDGSGFRNQPIRDRVLTLLNANKQYRKLFGKIFPDVNQGGPINFAMVGAAIAEFEFTLTFADAPIDRFARGKKNAMTPAQKRGAILFFGSAGCVNCHSVSGASNEMFSDFLNHNIGVPQIAAEFGLGAGNVVFDGPNDDEDFGLEQISGNSDDRYKFRTSPLRNIALQPTFGHNGAFTRLEDMIRHHLDVVASANSYDPGAAGVDGDLFLSSVPVDTVLDTLDPLLEDPIDLSDEEVADLVEFVGGGLLDPRARPEMLLKLVPKKLPSGLSGHLFEQP
jgi:cytochrome c peroxidase